MGNVVIAHPKVRSIDWIKMSSIVATITGTVGTEAILLKNGPKRPKNCQITENIFLADVFAF